MLPFKKLTAWRKQFSKRGFTMDKVRRKKAWTRTTSMSAP